MKNESKKPIKEASKSDIITNADLYRFRKGLQNLSNTPSNSVFAFKVVKNLRIIQSELDDFTKILKPSEDYTKIYQPKLEAIAKKYCIKGEDGEPLPIYDNMGNAQYNFTLENKTLFDKAISVLEKQDAYVKLVKEREEQMEQFNKLLDKPCEITFSLISQDILPNEVTPAQLALIFELITG